MTERPDSPELAAMRRRLKFRSWHRGTREADLLLGTFADRHLDRFSPEQLARYDRLLGNSDPDLYNWLTGREAVPADQDDDVMALLKEHKYQSAED